MDISFERSGGIAGIPIKVKFDTASLSPEEAKQLSQLIEDSRFFELPTSFSSLVQPDRFLYKLVVREGDRQHAVTVGEAATPETLKPLLAWLSTVVRRE